MQATETKAYLLQIGKIDQMIRNKLSEIYRLREMAYGVAAPNVGERVQTSLDIDKLGTASSRIIDMENEMKKMADIREVIVRQIESIEDADIYDVLAKRYILRKKIKGIAAESGISYRAMEQRHSKAIKVFEERYGEKYL